MWHEIVSFVESTAHVVVLGCTKMGSLHPLTTVGILLLFVLLVAMLCAEIIENRVD